MQLNTLASPVSLSYAAALRGVLPRRPGEAFTYAVLGGAAPNLLVGLAASNPEGQFYGFVPDEASLQAITAQAKSCDVTNVTFLIAQLASASLPPLDYLICDESAATLTVGDRTAIFDLAAKTVKPGGIFSYSYRAYPDDAAALKFLVREAAPEMNPEQATAFLMEIKKLGTFYYQNHPGETALLDQAIVKNMPDAFFSQFDDGDARSGAFDTIVALRPRGFAYASDAKIGNNYIQLAAPALAQPIILACAGMPLYEPVKDFALNRQIRHDIWYREPAYGSFGLAELFGGFAYGITIPQADVPAVVDAHGIPVRLDSDLYRKLIELMTLMPISIGDFLSHPSGQGFTPDEVVAAIQILVACDIALPMRGDRQTGNLTSLAQPRLNGGFNRHLDQLPVAGSAIPLASTVLGSVVTVSPRDALVMQALDRAGLANSVSALLPELERLAKSPKEAASVMDSTTPTPESARQMIEDACSASIVQWYAYGLLQAA